MRLALDEVPKTITRRRGERHVVPLLLRPGERARELGALIALYESWLGRERAGFPVDRPAELIGDYRLARCLETCLGEWYAWQSPPWPGRVAAGRAEALAERGIVSPPGLRLALYDAVNRDGGGYLPAGRRDEALAAFAAGLGLDRDALDELLYLDDDERTVLGRVVDTAPTAAELAERYNQRAFEAVMGGAARIELTITAPRAIGGGGGAGEGLGTTVKRICFLARTMGVQYDVAFDAPEEARADADGDGRRSMVAEHVAPYRAGDEGAGDGTEGDGTEGDGTEGDGTEVVGALAGGGPLVVTLYGPQEVTGAPAQYGDRLARLCRALLGYRRGSRDGHGALAGANVGGTAVVYLHGRPLLFALDDRTLRLIGTDGASGEAGESESGGTDGASGALDFDSELERALHAEFAALEAAGEAHGWRLEREPEPIVVDGTILVPDFALTRGGRRVYLEVAGYWRPEYRERKLRKLLAVRERVALAVAAPEAARGELEAAARVIPLLWYRNRVSAQGLLGLLERAYDDHERRLAALDPARVLAEVARRGRIPAAEAYAALRCYTRNELAEAVERVRAAAERAGEAAPEWIEGVGLCGPTWLERAIEATRGLVVDAAGEGRVPLAAARARLAGTLEVGDVPEAAVEALARRAGLAVVRDSLFEGYLARDGVARAADAPGNVAGDRDSRGKTQPRGRSRRKHSVESVSQHSMLSLFSPEHTGPDDTEPDTPPGLRTHLKEARRGR